MKEKIIKFKIYKLEIYQKDKGWEVNITLYGSGSAKTYCFSTAKQMLRFIEKITV